MNATDMVQGNLALKLETPAAPAFTVVKGGRSGFQTLPGKPVRSQCVATTSAPVALKASTIVALAVALTLFFVLATSIFSARHAAYAESASTLPMRPSVFSLAIPCGRLLRNIPLTVFLRRRLLT